MADQEPRDEFTEKMAAGVVPTLADCERHIAKVTTQWLLAVGYALRAIRDHELYREKGYTSFTAYLRSEHPWHPTYVSRVIADVPVVEVLDRNGRLDRDANEGQMTAIRPVLEEHGEAALLEVWDRTEGKRSAAALVRTARRLGYLPPEDGEAKPDPPAAVMSPTLVRFRQLADLLNQGEGRSLIMAAKENPDWVRGALMPALRKALDLLESEFPDEE